MAEGGDFRRSVQGASDAIYDFNCSYCEKEALFFCEKCIKNVCTKCTAAHTRLYRHHVLLGRDKIHVWQGAEMLKDRCLRHTYTEADMYCRDHDEVCCHLCITTDHR